MTKVSNKSIRRGSHHVRPIPNLLTTPELHETILGIASQEEYPQALIIALPTGDDGNLLCSLLVTNSDGNQAYLTMERLIAPPELELTYLEGCVHAANWARKNNVRVILTLFDNTLTEKLTDHLERGQAIAQHEEIWLELLSLRQSFGLLTYDASGLDRFRVVTLAANETVIYARPPRLFAKPKNPPLPPVRRASSLTDANHSTEQRSRSVVVGGVE